MRKPFPLVWPEMDEWLRRALAEDVGSGDLTTEALIEPATKARMRWTAKKPTVWCGGFVAVRLFELLEPELRVKFLAKEGAEVRAGTRVLEVEAEARALLCGERTALNLVQRLSGIAAHTREYAATVRGTRTRICATRKTTPYLRRLEKYAVSVGGGSPHRFGLDDGILLKDNHLALAGSIREAVKRVRARGHHLVKVEVEVRNIQEAAEAIAAGADVILCDHMGGEELTEVVRQAHARGVLVEASGNISLTEAKALAQTGVDFISVGELTHSAPAADISASITPFRRK